jgi:hypothetical protein
MGTVTKDGRTYEEVVLPGSDRVTRRLVDAGTGAPGAPGETRVVVRDRVYEDVKLPGSKRTTKRLVAAEGAILPKSAADRLGLASSQATEVKRGEDPTTTTTEGDGGDGDGPTLEDLTERARELDISGRSKMNKDELASAIADEEARLAAEAEGK